jgi:hypothetical protein
MSLNASSSFYKKRGKIFYVNNYDPLNDNSGDTVSEWLSSGKYDKGLGWTTLANIQSLYPSPIVVSLEDTIDEVAFRRAWQDAKNFKTVEIVFGDGYYVFTKQPSIWLYFASNSSVTIRGKSKERTILRRKEGTCTDPGQPMITLSIGAGFTVNEFKLENLALDGYARENPLPERLPGQTDIQYYYQWEQSATFKLICASNSFLKNAIIQKCYVTDAVADSIALVINTQNIINNQSIYKNITGGIRNRVRSDLIWQTGIEYVLLENCHVPTIECEHKVLADSMRNIIILDSSSNILDIAGEENDFNGYTKVNVQRTSTNNFYYAFASGIYENCDLKMNSGGALKYPNPTTFKNCNIKLPVNSGNVTSLTIFRSSLNTKQVSDVTFDSCNFIADSIDPGPFLGWQFNPAAVAQAAFDNLHDRTTFVNCNFDNRCQYSILANRTGHIITENCNLTGTVAGVSIGYGGPSGIVHFYSSWVDKGSNFDNCLRPFTVTSIYNFLDGYNFVDLDGVWKASWDPIEGHPANIAEVNWTSTRTLYITGGAPTQGIVGDKVIRTDPIIGQPWKWTCTTTHPTAATFNIDEIFTG